MRTFLLIALVLATALATPQHSARFMKLAKDDAAPEQSCADMNDMPDQCMFMFPMCLWSDTGFTGEPNACLEVDIPAEIPDCGAAADKDACQAMQSTCWWDFACVPLAADVIANGAYEAQGLALYGCAEGDEECAEMVRPFLFMADPSAVTPSQYWQPAADWSDLSEDELERKAVAKDEAADAAAGDAAADDEGASEPQSSCSDMDNLPEACMTMFPMCLWSDTGFTGEPNACLTVDIPAEIPACGDAADKDACQAMQSTCWWDFACVALDAGVIANGAYEAQGLALYGCAEGDAECADMVRPFLFSADPAAATPSQFWQEAPDWSDLSEDELE